MTVPTSRLDYYAGDIKAAVVLALVIGVALIGLGDLSYLPAFLIAAGSAGAITAALHIVQRRINSGSIEPIRAVNHPELGKVSVYRRGWQSQVSDFGTAPPFTLMGRGASDGPTPEQLALWQALRERQQTILETTHRALSEYSESARLPYRSMDFPLSLVQLDAPNTFMFFFIGRPDSPRRVTGYFVRFKDMNVIEVGRTPWKGRRREA